MNLRVAFLLSFEFSKELCFNLNWGILWKFLELVYRFKTYWILTKQQDRLNQLYSWYDSRISFWYFSQTVPIFAPLIARKILYWNTGERQSCTLGHKQDSHDKNEAVQSHYNVLLLAKYYWTSNINLLI